eukprot:TRINITY_DN357_c0_g1_i1.p1 TRINITY_DN357_c0_g1~~TRINITY_DN357_c0_g1_i1.p1  ORF type:complete len:516 (+),score=137.18 TRINITY_DN357_c0_g1_i1:27-1574(+)
MVHKKKQSKRISLHVKHKIERRVREHHRKVRKEQRAKGINPAANKFKQSQDVSIPNMHPFKAQLMAQMERRQVRIAQDQQMQKQRRHQLVANARKKSDQMSMEQLQRDAQRRAVAFARQQAMTDDGAGPAVIGSQRAFYKELNKVIEAADVIIEVLDARDPMGCRCAAVENLIVEQGGKKVVLLLNKIDLVPKDVVQQWLTYLRGFFPTIAFKASTQQQRAHLSQSAVDVETAPENALKSEQCLGANTLLQLLKNYCRNADRKTGITVGIIGYPNVGKSSVINSLKRTKVAQVGSTPGVTRSMQEVHLDKLVKLLDCPGIVFSPENGSDAILRNAVKIETLDDPVTPVGSIVKRCKKQDLMESYVIPAFKDANEFLFFVAQKMGKLKRGGVPDLESAARAVLKHWNEGKIPFFTLPPATKPSAVHVGAAVVSSYGREFNMDEVANAEQSQVLTSLQPHAHGFMAMESSEMHNDVDVGDSDSEMDGDDDGSDNDSEDDDEDDDEDDGESMEESEDD